MAYDSEANAPFEHLVRHACELIKQFSESSYRKTKLEGAAESRRVYDQQSKTLSEPWEGAANVCLPLAMITIDNLEPRIVAGLVGSRPYCRLELEGQQQGVSELGKFLPTGENDGMIQAGCPGTMTPSTRIGCSRGNGSRKAKPIG